MHRRAWLLLFALAALWGASYMLIKVALVDLDPVAIVFVRTLLGALVLVPLAVARDALRPVARVAGPVTLAAVVQIAVPFLLITVGEQHITSALAGILVSSGPLFTALLAVRLDPAERSHGWGLVGVLTGILGVTLLFGVELSGDVDALLGGLAVLAASAGYAGGALVVRRRCRGVPPIGVAAVSLSIATVLLLPALPFALPSDVPRVETVAALVLLGAGGTGMAFLIVYTLIADVGPARASLATYIAPGFAVIYGALLLDESVASASIAGLALVLAGSFLSAEARLPWRRTTARGT